MKTSLLVLLMSAVPAQDNTYKDQVTHDFRKGLFTQEFLGRVGPWNTTVEETPEGLHIRFPEGQKEPQTVGVASKLYAHGNFEFTVSYKLISPEKPKTGYGAGVMIWLMLDVKGSPFAAVARRSQPNGAQLFNSSRGSYPDGKLKQEIKPTPAKAREGRLRLVREGSTLKYMLQEPGDADFRIFRVEENFGTQPVKHTKIGADRGMSQEAMEVLLEEVTIRADTLSPELTPQAPSAPGVAASTPTSEPTSTPAAAPSRSYTSLWWVAGGGAAVLVIAGSGWFFLRRRKEEEDEEDEEE